jgi:hypothetical protein
VEQVATGVSIPFRANNAFLEERFDGSWCWVVRSCFACGGSHVHGAGDADPRKALNHKSAFCRLSGYELLDADPQETARLIASKSWKSRLLRSKKGRVLPLVSNILTPLREAAEWQGVFGVSEDQVFLYRDAPWGPPAPRPWDDYMDVIWLMDWLQRHGIFLGRELIRQGVYAIAHAIGPVNTGVQTPGRFESSK